MGMTDEEIEKLKEQYKDMDPKDILNMIKNGGNGSEESGVSVPMLSKEQ
mgnify:CR=1 FL=1